MNRNRDACKLVCEWLKLIKKRLISSTFYPSNLTFRFELFWCKRGSLALPLVWGRRCSGRVTSYSDVGATPSPLYVRGLNSCRFTQDLLSFWLRRFTSIFRSLLPVIMNSRTQKDRGQKQNTNQVILSELLKEEANRFCADCGAKGK